MARSYIMALVLACASAAACGDTASSGGDNPDGGGAVDMGPPPYPTWSAQSPAVCGQAPYTWQPAAQVGSVLSYSKNLLGTSSVIIEGLELAAYVDTQLHVKHAVNYSVHTATVRYQTQDRGQLVDATAMVTWPTTSGTYPVLLFLHPTLGYTDDCAPSKSATDLTAPMTIFSLIAASAGYIAVFPDYLNQRSLGQASTHVTPYLLMEPTALVSLDAVRAAQNYLKKNETSLASNDVYVWGHSQGAQAVEYVDALQPLYAPELTIKAAAAVSPPSDVPASAQANFMGPAPTFNLGEAIAYAWSDYYDISQVNQALLPPWSGTALTEMKNYCNSNYKDPINSVTDYTTIFTPLFLDVFDRGLRHDPFSCWLHYNNPATMDPKLNPSVPMLYVTGDKDTTVVPTANDPVAAKWCQQGIQIEWLQCAGADHVHTISDSVDNVLNFFDDRQAGKPLPMPVCQPTPAQKCISTP
jgi:pimeloyl-ACP methyl ester carboxylesterase